MRVSPKDNRILEENANFIDWRVISCFSSTGSSDGDSDDDSDSESSDDETSAFKDSARPRDESPESKKLRKKAVKDAKAEKRKSKLKKHVKKRKEKQGTKKKWAEAGDSPVEKTDFSILSFPSIRCKWIFYLKINGATKIIRLFACKRAYPMEFNLIFAALSLLSH